MLAKLTARLATIPRRVWIIAGIAVVFIGVIAAALIILDPFAGPFEVLSAREPAVSHPDGLVARLNPGSRSASVQIKTTPREAFLADEAGGSWAEARAALPEGVTPLSPIYSIRVRGEGSVNAEMTFPNDAEPLELLDLYRWDEQSRLWVFVPSTQDASRQVITFTPERPVSHMLAVRAGGGSIAAGIVISPGGPDLGPDYGLAIPEGISISPDMSPTGEVVPASGSTVLPLITSSAPDLDMASELARTRIASGLRQIMLDHDGVALDFGARPGLAEIVTAVAEEAHSHGKRLDVVVRGTSLDGYDLAAIGASADRVWLAPGDNPNLYLPGGLAETALRRLVSQVDRRKVGLWVSALNVDVVGDQATARGLSDSLSIFGGVVTQEGYSHVLAPGDSIAVRLSGSIASIGFDPVLAMNYATYLDEQGQTHYAYFASPANLERQLKWARQYALGSVAVYGIAHPESPQHIADGLTAFLSQQAIGSPDAIQLSWNVTGASGAKLNEQSGDLGLIQYLWQAAVDPGTYVINASVSGSGQDGPISTLEVQVGQVQPVAGTPTPTATPTATVSSTPSKSSGTATPQATPAPVTGVVAAGTFEIGGQVSDSMANAGKMQHAGMKWVKFQHKWSPGEGAGIVADKINAAHSAGFKVLLSIPGQQPVTAIDYAGYVNFLSGVAALGPDAIEVWNEMNFDREWPVSELGGGSYTTNMLAPAYSAIKSVNPAVMVISGAPTPTGAFPAGCGFSDLANEHGCNDYEYLAQMRDAGAANYADCVGIHFNSGATSPAATTGHPNDGGDHHYSWYYQPMVNLYYGTLGKPLCFTELGYASAQGLGSAPGGFPWASSVSVSNQAQWLAETAVLASQSGKVRLMIVWNVDFTGGGSDPKGMYAMIRPDGTCPACDALNSVVQP